MKFKNIFKIELRNLWGRVSTSGKKKKTIFSESIYYHQYRGFSFDLDKPSMKSMETLTQTLGRISGEKAVVVIS
jgi:hypothetical protein